MRSYSKNYLANWSSKLLLLGFLLVLMVIPLMDNNINIESNSSSQTTEREGIIEVKSSPSLILSNATIVSDGYLGGYWNNDSSGDPSVAVDGSGNVHVVWEEDTAGEWGTDREVMYCNYTTANGWSNITVVSDGYSGSYWNDGSSEEPRVAVDGSGNVHVVWSDGTDGEWGTDYEIMYCNYTAANGWSNITVVSDGYSGSYWNNGSSEDPRVAVDGSENVHVVWTDDTEGEWGTDYEIMYCNYTAANGWSNATVISDGYSGSYWNDGESYSSSIFVDASGNVHIAWDDHTDGNWGTDREIMYCNYTAANGWSNVTVVSDGYSGSYWNNDYSGDPSIAVDDSGNVHLTWEEETNGTWGGDIEVMYCNYTAAYGWSNVTVVSDGYSGSYWNNDDSRDPSLAVDGSGNLHLVWEDLTNGKWGIDIEIMYCNYTIANGWSNVTVVSDGYLGSYWNNDDSRDPSVAADNRGNAYIVWEDETNGIWGIDREIMYTSLELPEFWRLNSIHIDNNWSLTASTYGWCYGAGTWADPYIIENVIINCEGSGSGIFIENSQNAYFTIQNCTVYNSGSGSNDAGIRLDNSRNGTLYINNCSKNGRFGISINSNSQNNTISTNIVNDNQDWGINVDGPSNIIFNNTVANSQTTDQEHGIYFTGSCINNYIINNTISNHTQNAIYTSGANSLTIANNTIDSNRVGMYIGSSNNFVLSANTFTDCGLVFYGNTWDLDSHIIYDNNTVNGKHIYYMVNQNYLNTADFSTHGAPGQIVLVNCNHSLITGLNISDTSTGIHLIGSHNNTVSNCIITYNQETGIYIEYSANDNTIINNTFDNNGDAIDIIRSANRNNITENIIENSTGAGIAAWNSYSNNYFNNTIRNNAGYGIHIESTTSDFWIYNNTINDNAGMGIFFQASANNRVINNTCMDTAGGLVQNTGIYVTASTNITISLNKLDNAQTGAYLNSGTNCNITDNTMIGGFHGVQIFWNSHNNTVYGNTIYGGTSSGVRIDNTCNNNTISNNNITDSTTGIYITTNCDYNNITGNLLNDHSNYGLDIQADCDHIIITGNVLNYNTLGAYQDAGSDNSYKWNVFNWNLIDPFTIDESGGGDFTWNEAFSVLAWLSGSGSWNDPYLIENLFLDVGGTGCGISIKNSIKYFILSNLTVYNTGLGASDAGIYLFSTSNGTIIDGNCSANGYSGISLINICKNNTISNNELNNLGGIGIILNGNNVNNIIEYNRVFGNAYGMYILAGSDKNTIYNNTVYSSASYGIYLDSVNRNNASRNYITTSPYGFYISNSDNNNISSNIVNGNTVDGIRIISDSDWNTVFNNTANNNGQTGIRLEVNCHFNDILNNTIKDNQINGIQLDNNCDFNNISYNNASNMAGTEQNRGIHINNGCDNNTIHNNELIDNADYGIYISAGCYENNITSNLARSYDGSQDSGIYLHNTCEYNRITANTVIYNSDGIYIHDNCDNNIISGNTVDSNILRGIRIRISCHNNTISFNNVSNEGSQNYGISIGVDSYYNKIFGNTASNNTNSGIYLFTNCDFTIIANNTLYANPYGSQSRGIFIQFSSENTTIYNNTCYGHTFYGIIIDQGCNSNNISSNTLYNNSNSGLYMDETLYNNITNNHIYDNTNFGINLDSTNNSLIIGNRLHGANNEITQTNCINNVENMNSVEGVYTSLYIDDTGAIIGSLTWAEAEQYDWCSGAGMWSDPYVIEDILINAGGSGSGIIIENSQNEYFIIRNCTVYNSGTNNVDAGIKIVNSNNGLLEDNNCSNNGWSGIYLNNNCNNITISNNSADENGYAGIYLYNNCKNNTIIDNSIRDNYYYGIFLYTGCDNNTISGNNVTDTGAAGTQEEGIYLHTCDDNIIFDNNASNNIDRGIRLFNLCVGNKILDNTAHDNVDGIYITQGCDSNYISNNSLYDNSNSGLFLDGCNSNNITNNLVYDNTNYGIYLDSSNNSLIISNLLHGANNEITQTNCQNNVLSMNSINGVFTSIFIDNEPSYDTGSITWAEAAQYYWCSGSGTWADPYLIEDIIINGLNQTYGLHIKDSSVYFIIDNCTFYNAGPTSSDAGIYLDFADNGKIINSNCSDNNRHGITIYRSNNNTIENNDFKDNRENGMNVLSNSYNNTIIGNNASNSNDNYYQDIGILLTNGCADNNISNNFIINNDAAGIYLLQDCYRNTIFNNTVRDMNVGIQDIGIILYTRCNNNSILYNTIMDSFSRGIYLYQNCSNNFIKYNTVINFLSTIQDKGIYLRDNCDNNQIIGNNVSFNEFHGIHLFLNCDFNNITGNNASFNTENGIYLENYCTFNNIFGNTLNRNTQNGIFLDGNCDSNNITSNTAAYNTVNGIYLFKNSNNNAIIGNNVSLNTKDGIYMNSSQENDIILNTAFNNDGMGIQLELTINSTLIDNTCDNNTYGIYIIKSSNFNNIIGNTANENDWVGLLLSQNCNNNTLESNTLNNNLQSGLLLYINCINNTLTDNTANGNKESGINLVTGCNFNDIIGNTANYNNGSGIYLWDNSNNNTISGNTLNENDNCGIQLLNCQYNKILDNSETIDSNGVAGILLENSHYNRISGNSIKNNPIGVNLSSSNTNTITNNIFRDNGENHVNTGTDNYISNNDYGKGNGESNGEEEPPEEPPSDPILIIIIFIVIGSAIAIASGGYVVTKKKTKVPPKKKQVIPPKKDISKKDKLPTTDVKISEAEVKPSAIMPKVSPKKLKEQKAHKGSKAAKKGKIDDASAPHAGLTELEKKEIEQTESELAIEKKQYICVVHKGPIDADNIYLCPNCHTLYCTKCAITLKEKGEKCWSCENEIKVSTTPQISSETQLKIQDLEAKLDSLKITAKNLDDTYYTGAVEEEEYVKMKTSLGEKIRGIIEEIKQLKG